MLKLGLVAAAVVFPLFALGLGGCVDCASGPFDSSDDPPIKRAEVKFVPEKTRALFTDIAGEWESTAPGYALRIELCERAQSNERTGDYYLTSLDDKPLAATLSEQGASSCGALGPRTSAVANWEGTWWTNTNAQAITAALTTTTDPYTNDLQLDVTRTEAAQRIEAQKFVVDRAEGRLKAETLVGDPTTSDRVYREFTFHKVGPGHCGELVQVQDAGALDEAATDVGDSGALDAGTDAVADAQSDASIGK